MCDKCTQAYLKECKRKEDREFYTTMLLAVLYALFFWGLALYLFLYS